MIFTHPVLFNCIVVLFIAFTSGWIVFVVLNREVIQLKNKIAMLEHANKAAAKQLLALEEQLEKSITHSLTSAPVISFSSSVKANPTG